LEKSFSKMIPILSKGEAEREGNFDYLGTPKKLLL
jgi:hypothetical protein